jgi:hypothetical protein
MGHVRFLLLELFIANFTLVKRPGLLIEDENDLLKILDGA